VVRITIVNYIGINELFNAHRREWNGKQCARLNRRNLFSWNNQPRIFYARDEPRGRAFRRFRNSFARQWYPKYVL